MNRSLVLAFLAGVAGTASAQNPSDSATTWEYRILRSRVADSLPGIETPVGRRWMMVWIEVQTAEMPPTMLVRRIRLTDAGGHDYPAVAMDCEAAPHRMPLFVFFADLKRRGEEPRTFAGRGVWGELFHEVKRTFMKLEVETIGYECRNAGPSRWTGKEWTRDEPLLFLLKPDTVSPRITFRPYAKKQKTATLSFLFPVTSAGESWRFRIGDGPPSAVPIDWGPRPAAWFEELERYEYADVVRAQDIRDIVLSNDGEQLAVVIRHSSQWPEVVKRYALLARNHEVKPVTHFDVDHLVFSPDGRRLAYVFSSLNGFDPAPGSRDIRPGDQLVRPPNALQDPAAKGEAVEFGWDRQRLAYVYVHANPDFAAATGSTVYGLAINDTIISPPDFRHISRPVFQLDGQRIAYIRGQKSLNTLWEFSRNPGPQGDLVVDGTVLLSGGTFSYGLRGMNTLLARIGPLHRTAGVGFKPEGTVIYPAQWDKQWYLMTGTKRASEGFDAMGRPVIDPGGKVTFAAKRGKEWFIVSGVTRVPGTYEDVGLLTLGPNGETLAYPAKQEDRWYVFVNGTRASEECWYASELAFSADSKHLAALLEVGKKVLLSDRGRNQVVVLDGKRVSREFGIGTIRKLTVSPDGSKVAYLVEEASNGDLVQNLYVNDQKLGAVADYTLRRDGKLVIALFDATRMQVVRGVVDF